jgi:hypothetical protein
MSPLRVANALLSVAVLVFAAALVGRAADVLSETAVDALALAGLGLLAVGQAIRVTIERSVRTVAILLLVLALIAFVLID